MIRTVLRATALLALLLASAWAEEAAVTRRATELRDQPADGGRSLAALPARSPVMRTDQRQGPWVQVRSAQGATGWVHMFDLGPAATAGTASAGESVVGGALRGVSGLFGGGGNRATQTSTTAGIRGLGAEDLAQAQPDTAAVKQMEALRPADADVRSFADRAAWRPAAVAPLPAPARASVSSDPSRNPAQPQSP